MTEIKRICSEVAISERVQRISDMKWAGQKHKAHTGLCQFCGNVLEYAYRVFTPDGRCHEVTAESAGGAKAQLMIDENSIPEGTHVFSLAACEVMCDDKVYADGIRHYEQRSEEWTQKVQYEARNRVTEVQDSTSSGGAAW